MPSFVRAVAGSACLFLAALAPLQAQTLTPLSGTAPKTAGLFTLALIVGPLLIGILDRNLGHRREVLAAAHIVAVLALASPVSMITAACEPESRNCLRTSMPEIPVSWFLSSVTLATASAIVLLSFQLPTTNGVRMIKEYQLCR